MGVPTHCLTIELCSLFFCNNIKRNPALSISPIPSIYSSILRSLGGWSSCKCNRIRILSTSLFCSIIFLILTIIRLHKTAISIQFSIRNFIRIILNFNVNNHWFIHIGCQSRGISWEILYISSDCLNSCSMLNLGSFFRNHIELSEFCILNDQFTLNSSRRTMICKSSLDFYCLSCCIDCNVGRCFSIIPSVGDPISQTSLHILRHKGFRRQFA